MRAIMSELRMMKLRTPKLTVSDPFSYSTPNELVTAKSIAAEAAV
jgi:hypothetical protein